VVATYVKDECELGMTIRLPPSYPLRPVEVSCARRLGIGEARWRRWVLQIVTLLSVRDGSVLDAVLLWKRNVDKVSVPRALRQCTVAVIKEWWCWRGVGICHVETWLLSAPVRAAAGACTCALVGAARG
jgi:hypothetical protein